MSDFVVDAAQPLARSRLWQLQRAFFERHGTGAWINGPVPHGITSSPAMGRAYARVLAAWLADCARDGADDEQPHYIVELGGGVGRLAFHVLRHLHARAPRSRWTYVLTDVVDANLDFCARHPSLKPFVDAGLLDFARFDVAAPAPLRLLRSGRALTTVTNPLALVANYVFDSVPADAFRVEDGQLSETLVTLLSQREEPDVDDPELLSRLRLRLDSHPIALPHYHDDELDQLLALYRDRLTATTFLMPTAGIACLRHFAAASSERLLVLCGDKGEVSIKGLLRPQNASLVLHGSFSANVNFHALAELARRRGGRVLHTAHRALRLNVLALLVGRASSQWTETAQAFADAVERSGPDDLFALGQLLREQHERLSLDELLVLLRASAFDPGLLVACSDTLSTRLEHASDEQREELARTLDETWRAHYPIGDQRDVAFTIGTLLLRLERFAEALTHFQHSLALHGPDASTHYNAALCHLRMGRTVSAREHVERALSLAPQLEAARALRLHLEEHKRSRP